MLRRIRLLVVATTLLTMTVIPAASAHTASYSGDGTSANSWYTIKFAFHGQGAGYQFHHTNHYRTAP